jgi:hypothetical protein
MNENSKSMGGAFLIILFAVFASLKITGVISWSWLWVTSPLWIPVAICAGCVALIIACIILWALITILFGVFL